MTTATGTAAALPGMPSPAPTPILEQQLALLGAPQPIRIPEQLWRSWLDDPGVVTRFEAKRYWRGENRCAPWVGGVSSTGHGSFRAANLPGPSRRGTVPAHLFAYQLEHGIIPRLGWSGADDTVLCHQCDFAGCTNPHHLILGTNRSNRNEYDLRRRNLASPLADVRGAAGRTRAIATAIRTGLAHQENPELNALSPCRSPTPLPSVAMTRESRIDAKPDSGEQFCAQPLMAPLETPAETGLGLRRQTPAVAFTTGVDASPTTQTLADAVLRWF